MQAHATTAPLRRRQTCGENEDTSTLDAAAGTVHAPMTHGT
jgi:hypothetical protein